jgi:hypothetical protein
MNQRIRLYFSQEVSRAFSFLETEFNFSQIITSEQKVRYESADVFVEINHGDYDFEISITFGRCHTAEAEKFDFFLFLRLKNPSLEKALGERIADKPDAIREIIGKIVHAFYSEGMDIINNNNAIFERMKTVTWWQFSPDSLEN